MGSAFPSAVKTSPCRQRRASQRDERDAKRHWQSADHVAFGAKDRFQDLIKGRRGESIVITLTSQDPIDQAHQNDERKKEAIVIDDRKRLEPGGGENLNKLPATVTAEMMMAYIMMIEQEGKGRNSNEQPALGPEDPMDRFQSSLVIADVLDDIEAHGEVDARIGKRQMSGKLACDNGRDV
jgi:hypothetical protein